MTPFMTEDFLLDTEFARRLYHDYAKDQPIFDYHCHLPPQQIAEDYRFKNLYDIWLKGDHYKWRAMRTNGVAERLCTGDASDREKFDAWAATVPHTIGNPLYHWTHLELRRPFGITGKLLSPSTADEIWNECNELLAQDNFSARGIMQQMNVKMVGTTDDPVDSLEHHAAISADSSFDVKVRPTWRPDKGFAIGAGAAWNAWVDRLEAAADVSVTTFDEFVFALKKRHNFFSSHGCRLSDYGLETIVAEPCTEADARRIFAKVRGGGAAAAEEVVQFKSHMLFVCGAMDAESDWTWQLHYNALRNNNSRLFKALGPDVGCDSIGDWPSAAALGRLFDALDREDRLPRTIVYTLNPCDNEVIASMIGNFQRAPTAGKMQFGSGWWFNDQKDGMERQMEALSQMGLLSRFVGMLTDSRSFLSYTRHEYFRRILCNLLGDDIETGRAPRDFALVGAMVQDICYNNADRYFGF